MPPFDDEVVSGLKVVYPYQMQELPNSIGNKTTLQIPVSLNPNWIVPTDLNCKGNIQYDVDIPLQCLSLSIVLQNSANQQILWTKISSLISKKLAAVLDSSLSTDLEFAEVDCVVPVGTTLRCSSGAGMKKVRPHSNLGKEKCLAQILGIGSTSEKLSGNGTAQVQQNSGTLGLSEAISVSIDRDDTNTIVLSRPITVKELVTEKITLQEFADLHGATRVIVNGRLLSLEEAEPWRDFPFYTKRQKLDQDNSPLSDPKDLAVVLDSSGVSGKGGESLGIKILNRFQKSLGEHPRAEKLRLYL
ncbi:MAG: hypothetical protein KDD53_07240, partial [Bdellovibrionales bacterium]|nr:hypothetical protein [Bdellovibrionales bacterium]